jgi:type II secretory pathway component GspD/PulD (secretin)
VDVAPKQLAIEMRVMELSKEDAMQLGINWSILTGGTVKTINLNQSQTGIGNNQGPANVVTGRVGFNGNSFAGVTASLDAIANKNNLISRPNLLAIDGRESEIFVGDDIKYVSSIISSQTGPTITSDEIKVGVRLSVLARVGGDGHITMDMRPVVSFLKGFNSTSGSGVTLNLPQTSVRFSQSTVNMQSGETIAIGGLIQDQDILNVQKLPFLGDLPILGQLFRSTTHDRKRSEVVFFLTVKEVTQDDRREAADPRPAEKANKGELPIPPRKIYP